VRDTERRFPPGLGAGDLGQSGVAPDGRCALISFATAPVVISRDNAYVLFVTDAALAAVANSFEWTFTENGALMRTESTDIGESRYQPSGLGALSVRVRLLDASKGEQAALSLDQEVVLPTAEVETAIAAGQNTPGPGAGEPAVLREAVYEHSAYYRHVAPRTPEPGDGLKRFVFGMVMDGVGRRTSSERRQHLARLAVAAADRPDEFARLAAAGAGVCNIRLALLAMAQPATPTGPASFLPWTELPETGPAHAFAEEDLRKKLGALSKDARIDLYNLTRFPKSNTAACARILEALRDRYFPGTTFDDVLAGLSGTRAHWIVRHYREGPLQKRS
jgi:hypothetical protein